KCAHPLGRVRAGRRQVNADRRFPAGCPNRDRRRAASLAPSRSRLRKTFSKESFVPLPCSPVCFWYSRTLAQGRAGFALADPRPAFSHLRLASSWILRRECDARGIANAKRKPMKRAHYPIGLLVCFAVTFSLAGCGGGKRPMPTEFGQRYPVAGKVTFD